MDILDIISLTLGISGLVSGGVAIYKSVRDPDEKAAKNEAVLEERMKKQDEVLELKLKPLRDGLALLMSNHLPHMDAKLDGLQKQMAEMDKTLTKFATIIEERIPKK